MQRGRDSRFTNEYNSAMNALTDMSATAEPRLRRVAVPAGMAAGFGAGCLLGLPLVLSEIFIGRVRRRQCAAHIGAFVIARFGGNDRESQSLSGVGAC